MTWVKMWIAGMLITALLVAATWKIKRIRLEDISPVKTVMVIGLWPGMWMAIWAAIVWDWMGGGRHG